MFLLFINRKCKLLTTNILSIDKFFALDCDLFHLEIEIEIII